MGNLKLEGKQLWNVHQLLYLSNEYPDKSMKDLGELFLLTMMDMNVAFWQAEELGYLLVNEKTSDCKVKVVPEKWELGPDVQAIEDAIMYTVNLLATREVDFVEDQLMMWLNGSPIQHHLTAVKHLLNEGKLATYKVTNITEIKPSKKGLKRGKQIKKVEDVYTFYTLPEHKDKEWGRRQFQDASRLS